MRVLKFTTLVADANPNKIVQHVTATFIPGGNTMNLIVRNGNGRHHLTTHLFRLGIMGWNDSRVMGYVGNVVSRNLMPVPTHNVIGS